MGPFLPIRRKCLHHVFFPADSYRRGTLLRSHADGSVVEDLNGQEGKLYINRSITLLGNCLSESFKMCPKKCRLVFTH
jgi:hypothetical protein